MNPRRLFVASCIALITSAFSFMIRQDISDPLGDAFSLTKQDIGGVMGAAFAGMAVAMLIMAPLCDFLGMGRVLFLAWLCHLTGILGTIFAHNLTGVVAPMVGADPSSTTVAYWVLFAATFLVGSGNGLVEIAINPLAATLYPQQKTHYLNILHAWWPGGLIMSGLLATFLIGQQPIGSIPAWKIKMGLLLVPLAIYGLMALGQKFPATERVQHDVSTKAMFSETLRPMFILWAFCMLLTASTELGPNQWQESVLTRTAGVSGTLVFVYTSGLMFVMRFFAGPLAHRLSPIGMMTGSAIFAAAGLYWLSYVNAPVMAFVAATIFGIGIAYFWPTMLGVTAERFPKGGALLLGLMGSFGNVAIAFALPMMGGIYDSYTVANLPDGLRDAKIVAPDGKELPLVITEAEAKWLPTFIAERIYPAGDKKLNPDARKLLDAKESFRVLGAASKDELVKEVTEAEKAGAAYAFRWVAVLPCVLIFIFGAIALTDRLRGGYKAEHIGEPALDKFKESADQLAAGEGTAATPPSEEIQKHPG
jgi:MFS family permease